MLYPQIKESFFIYLFIYFSFYWLSLYICSVWLTGNSWTSSCKVMELHRMIQLNFYPFHFKAETTNESNSALNRIRVHYSTGCGCVWIVLGVGGSYMELPVYPNTRHVTCNTLCLQWCLRRAVSIYWKSLEKAHMTAINPWIESSLDTNLQTKHRHDLGIVCNFDMTAGSIFMKTRIILYFKDL